MFNLISTQENEMLTEPFTLEEIEESLGSCEGDKSPGPDYFNFVFVKAS